MTKLKWKAIKDSSLADDKSPRWSFSRYFILVLLLLILFAVTAIMMIEVRVSPVLRAWGETKAINLATEAINTAVEEIMAQGTSNQIATIISDANGQIQAIQYNTSEINRLSATTAQRVLQDLIDLGSESLPIPLGQMLGLDFLSGYGPKIPLKIIPAGAVTTTPLSSFSAAGINQTIHRIYLDIEVEMQVVIPLVSTKMPVSMRVPIVEDIIVGAIPSWYFAPSGTVGGFAGDALGGSMPNQVEFKLVEP